MTLRAGIDPRELSAWLRLLLTDGIGRQSARRLLATFGSPNAIFEGTPAAWHACIGAARAQALAQPPADLAARVTVASRWLAETADAHVIALGDPDYPATLLQTADPPLVLFAQGDLTRLQPPAIAVVGSRNPTAQGLDNARAFSRALSEAGHVIVSGMALGIDGAAHEGALEGSQGTIAVIGCGPDRVYPARHRALAHKIVRHGLMLSEFAPGTPPLASNFPMRNRVIAGLAQGTLVVEAALRSGSLVTARLAAECGREVFAIPGSIHSPLARGCHSLIRQGAKLVESAQDILEELVGMSTPLASCNPASVTDDGGLLTAIGHDPVTLDVLSARTGWPADQLNVRLLELELDGHVARLPGGLFQRRHGA